MGYKINFASKVSRSYPVFTSNEMGSHPSNEKMGVPRNLYDQGFVTSWTRTNVSGKTLQISTLD